MTYTQEDFEKKIAPHVATWLAYHSEKKAAAAVYEMAKQMAKEFAAYALVAEGVRNGSFKRMQVSESMFQDWQKTI